MLDLPLRPWDGGRACPHARREAALGERAEFPPAEGPAPIELVDRSGAIVAGDLHHPGEEGPHRASRLSQGFVGAGSLGRPGLRAPVVVAQRRACR